MRIGGSILGLLLAACLGFTAPGGSAQGLQRLYVMDCGHNAATDQSRWSPGVSVGKPIELSDNATTSRKASVRSARRRSTTDAS